MTPFVALRKEVAKKKKTRGKPAKIRRRSVSGVFPVPAFLAHFSTPWHQRVLFVCNQKNYLFNNISDKIVKSLKKDIKYSYYNHNIVISRVKHWLFSRIIL